MMTNRKHTYSSLDMLAMARRVADYAQQAGYAPVGQPPRGSAWHLGAVLADSVLQAGVNYRTVVKPRVDRIIRFFPESATLSGTATLLDRQSVKEFLLWTHSEKINRFMGLFSLLRAHDVDDVANLRLWLKRSACRSELLEIRGIGPKTVDYMSCLVGIDSVAVDRHIRAFATNVGIQVRDYDALKHVFCFAADLLGSSRREFDSWVWNRAASRTDKYQFELL